MTRKALLSDVNRGKRHDTRTILKPLWHGYYMSPAHLLADRNFTYLQERRIQSTKPRYFSFLDRSSHRKIDGL